MSATPSIQRSYTVIVPPNDQDPAMVLVVVGVGEVNAVEEAVVLTAIQHRDGSDTAEAIQLQRHLPAQEGQTPTTVYCNILGRPCVETHIGDKTFALTKTKVNLNQGHDYLENLFLSATPSS